MAGFGYYYKPSEDRIQLVTPEQFRSEGYYATALHELAHWIGHKSRLDRDLKGRYRCAGLRLRVGGLCRRRTGGGDRYGLPVRQGRVDGQFPMQGSRSKCIKNMQIFCFDMMLMRLCGCAPAVRWALASLSKTVISSAVSMGVSSLVP